MKMTKKKVVVVAAVICLIAIISMGTLAWFVDTDEVTNKFTVSDSLTSFEVDVWEQVPDNDNDGEPEVIGKGDTSENEYTYEDVLPGKPYDKIVYVQNTSDNKLADQYIKVEVTFTNYGILKKLNATEDYNCTDMLKGGYFSDNANDTNTAWWYDGTVRENAGGSVTYTFYYKDVLKHVNDEGYEYSVPLFNQVVIPESMDINDADELYRAGGFEINVVAYAIQTANITNSEMSALDNAVSAFAEGGAYEQSTTAVETTVLP